MVTRVAVDEQEHPIALQEGQTGTLWVQTRGAERQHWGRRCPKATQTRGADRDATGEPLMHQPLGLMWRCSGSCCC